ncbi:hypothetical protein BS47DRAFT_1319298 [Hydnum rufescens UP504]|uniref:Uncharacterized protein n=1 Tax=Hydnum rufescens UP504 TaxID=1448309 RepID=A0A9P6ASC5_9AGAM|nr:hypothetical protein BS47DRAFT_1319298 [Hydnum rufescens UP504]
MSHRGKSALITGGASGLGKHLATTLHAQGAILLIADIDDDRGTAFVDSLNKERPGSAFFKKADVTVWEEQVDLFKVAVKSLKRIDYVVANAGILESRFLAHTSPSAVEYVKPDLTTLNINLIGVIYTSHIAAQTFRTQEIVQGFRGQIVVTASVASFTAIPNMPLYSTSKHALVGFVRAFGAQLEPEGITVNAVAPNITRSNLTVQEIFDAVEAKGRLTPNEAVTAAFTSFLGNRTLNGQIKEVSMDKTYQRPLPEPLNKAVVDNIAELAEVHRVAYLPPKA